MIVNSPEVLKTARRQLVVSSKGLQTDRHSKVLQVARNMKMTCSKVLQTERNFRKVHFKTHQIARHMQGRPTSYRIWGRNVLAVGGTLEGVSFIHPGVCSIGFLHPETLKNGRVLSAR